MTKTPEQLIQELIAVLEEALEVLDDYSDVVDGEDGQPRANKAMAMFQTIKFAIAKAEER